MSYSYDVEGPHVLSELKSSTVHWTQPNAYARMSYRSQNRVGTSSEAFTISPCAVQSKNSVFFCAISTLDYFQAPGVFSENFLSLSNPESPSWIPRNPNGPLSLWFNFSGNSGIH